MRPRRAAAKTPEPVQAITTQSKKSQPPVEVIEPPPSAKTSRSGRTIKPSARKKEADNDIPSSTVPKISGQPVINEVPDVPRKRGRAAVALESVPDAVQPPKPKKTRAVGTKDDEATEPWVAPTARRQRKKPAEKELPVEALAVPTGRGNKPAQKEDPVELVPEVIVDTKPTRTNRRAPVEKNPPVVEKESSPAELALAPTTRRTRTTKKKEDNPEPEKNNNELLPSKEPMEVIAQPTLIAVQSKPMTTSSASKTSPPIPVSSPVVVAITESTTGPSPTTTSTAVPQPLQRLPVYLQSTAKVNPLPVANKSPEQAPIPPPKRTAVQKRPATTADDQFSLMPLKPRATKRPQKDSKEAPATTGPVNSVEDDVYGFEFDDSAEPKLKKKKPVAAKRAKAAKPRKPRAAKKADPPGLRLWDEKDLQQRQRQIKLNVLNKDFKPVQKPIPPVGFSVISARPPQMNSTMIDSIQPPPPEIQITGIEKRASYGMSRVNYAELSSGNNPANNRSDGSSGGGGSKLMPWRYSTIHAAAPSMMIMGDVNVTMTSLNDSNAENVNPTKAAAATAHPMVSIARPLHTLQPQRSPMKELNPSETILVPRPPVGYKKNKSPVKRKTFGVENNFGFESDQEVDEEEEVESLVVERQKIDEKIDSLKKFRHSLNLGNSSSPLGIVPRQKKKATAAGPLPRQVTAIRNIFTSTPQQQKIRDAFQASTPIAGSSKDKDPPLPARVRRAVDGAEKDDDETPKLFESLTFEAPPKRNYSSILPRRRKKVDFFGFSDDDASDDEGPALDKSGVEDESAAVPAKTKMTKKAKAEKAHEEQLKQFCDTLNNEFDEVDKFEMIIEAL